MGRGDKKTKKGKIFSGSFGKARLARPNRTGAAKPAAAAVETATEAPVEAPKAKK